MFDTGIDRGTMSSIFLIDDLDNARKALSVLLGNIGCAVT